MQIRTVSHVALWTTSWFGWFEVFPCRDSSLHTVTVRLQPGGPTNNRGRVTAWRWVRAANPEIAQCAQGRETSRQIKAQLEDLNVKSKMAAVQRGFYMPVNAAFAGSQFSSLATLYYSFHTFEFFHLPREESWGEGK